MTSKQQLINDVTLYLNDAYTTTAPDDDNKQLLLDLLHDIRNCLLMRNHHDYNRVQRHFYSGYCSENLTTLYRIINKYNVPVPTYSLTYVISSEYPYTTYAYNGTQIVKILYKLTGDTDITIVDINGKFISIDDTAKFSLYVKPKKQLTVAQQTAKENRRLARKLQKLSDHK